MRVFRNPYVVTCAPCVRACVRPACADARRPKQRPSVAGSGIRGEQHVTRWLVLKGGGWDVFGGGGGTEGERTRNKVSPPHDPTTLSSSSSIRLCVWVARCSSSSSNELTGANKSVNGESLLPSTRVRASQVTTFQPALFFSHFLFRGGKSVKSCSLMVKKKLL